MNQFDFSNPVFQIPGGGKRTGKLSVDGFVKRIRSGPYGLAFISLYMGLTRVLSLKDGYTTIEIRIGDELEPQYLITFKLREAEEHERLKLREIASRIRRSLRSTRGKMREALLINAEFFDKHVEDITGGQVDGSGFAESEDRAAFLTEIDPFYKCSVTNAQLGVLGKESGIYFG